MNDTSLYMSVASVLTAIVSASVVIRGQRANTQTEIRKYDNIELQTIFDGYGQIIDELRSEVERLMFTIALLQEEQVECEKRNDSLREEIQELKNRLMYLEGK